jgi:Flp pilus assembly protein TadB
MSGFFISFARMLFRPFLLIVLPFTMLLHTGMAQEGPPSSTRKMKKRTRELEKTKQQQQQEQIDISADLKAQHRSNQSKAVRKRMKKNQKKAARHNDGRREFFGVRWWRSFTVSLQKWFKKGGKG